MANVLDRIKEKFISTAKKNPGGNVDKDDLERLLISNILLHKQLTSIFNTGISSKDMNDWMRNLKDKLKVSNLEGKNIYNDYQTKLSGKAASLERTTPFGSFKEANIQFISLLEDIQKNFSDLFDTEDMNIHTVKMSQLAVIGVLSESNKFVSFVSFLYNFLIRANANTADSLPKYRIAYMTEHLNTVAANVNMLVDKKGIANFMREIRDIKKSQADIIPGVDEHFDFQGHMFAQRFSISILDNIASALSHLNIFGAIADAWDDYKINKYRKDKEIKEWLEQHTALLRMELNDIDPTSPEYIKQMAIIKAYDEKITEYDEKITKFEQEDI